MKRDTGFKDKNGKCIYEGDTLRIPVLVKAKEWGKVKTDYIEHQVGWFDKDPHIGGTPFPYEDGYKSPTDRQWELVIIKK